MKRLLVVAVVCCSILSMIGCTKVISTEHREVEVMIVSEYYRPSYTSPQYNVALKMVTLKTYPATYRITVEYNGVEYDFSDKETHDKYKNRVGQTVPATLQVRTYDDGTVKHNIVELR